MTENRQENKPKEEVLSFEAITAEIGDITIPVAEDAAAETAAVPQEDFFSDIGGTVMGDVIPAPKTAEQDQLDRINSRILTGCSPETRHMYVEGFFCGGLAAVFLLPIVLRIALTQYQPWISYFCMLLTGGAAIWSLSGLQVETKVEGRRLCIISAVFCTAVFIIAYLFRLPPQSG